MELVKSGKTYENIGSRFGVSKSAIYLIMRDNFRREEVREALRESRAKRKKPPKYKTIKCIYCGKTKRTKYIYYTRKFCSEDCRKDFLKTTWYEAKKKQIQSNNRK